MAENTAPEIFNQEIAELEAKLAAKKQEMLRSGVESPEKTVFKQVVREHVATGQQPTMQISATSPQSSTGTATRAATPQEEEQLNQFIAHAFTNGLTSAINEAKRMNDPFFVDMLHDRLADEYYQKLVAAGKVNPS